VKRTDYEELETHPFSNALIVHPVERSRDGS